MKTTCPHCFQNFDTDEETLVSLQGQTHFTCPSCQGQVEVPPLSGHRPVAPQRATENSTILRSTSTKSTRSSVASNSKTHRGINRNILILGSVTLLVLGGLGFFLASHTGNIFNTEQKITNNIINNSYFEHLITSGATTEKDLNAIAEIRPYGTGFIGISREPLNWEQSVNLAKSTGSEVASIEDTSTGSKQKLLEWLKTTFASQFNSTIWVQQGGQTKVTDGHDVLSVSSVETARKVVLHWKPEDGNRDADSWKNAVNLMPLIDPDRDALTGKWEKHDGTLFVGSSPSAHIEIPYHPPEEYDFRVTFIRKSGAKSVNQILTKAGRTFVWDFFDNRWGFFFIGSVTLNNPTVRQRPFENGRRYTSTVHVRHDEISATVDGESISNWKTDYKDLTITNNWKLSDPTLLGLGSDTNETEFEKIELLEITGTGSSVR